MNLKHRDQYYHQHNKDRSFIQKSKNPQNFFLIRQSNSRNLEIKWSQIPKHRNPDRTEKSHQETKNQAKNYLKMNTIQEPRAQNGAESPHKTKNEAQKGREAE